MPIYEYDCSSCDNHFELLVRSGERPACPECGSMELEKQLSVPAPHSTASKSLPIAGSSGGCGLPQCGGGSCAFGD